MPGEQWTGVRHLSAARPQVLPDTTHGASGPQGRILETPGLSRLGSQTGNPWFLVLTIWPITGKLLFWPCLLIPKCNRIVLHEPMLAENSLCSDVIHFGQTILKNGIFSY